MYVHTYIYIHILSHTHTHTNSLSHTLSFVLSRSLSHSHTHRHSIATKRRRKRSITQDLCKIFFPPVCYIRDTRCADIESFRQVLWANTNRICWFFFSLCSLLSPRDSKIINMSNAGRLQRGYISRYVEILMQNRFWLRASWIIRHWHYVVILHIRMHLIVYYTMKHSRDVEPLK